MFPRAERRRAARPPRTPGIYIPNVGRPNTYTPSGPILAGAAKCAAKGHRPPRVWSGLAYCSRCQEQI